MEFIMDLIEIITVLALVLFLAGVVMYFMRHRERFGRWVNNFDGNTVEKEAEITRLIGLLGTL